MHAIRLIGQHHATHHEGEVLSIADERTARTNRNTVTQEHAHVLVERGDAEWVSQVHPTVKPMDPEDEEFERLLAEEERHKGEARGGRK
jgi:diadenosine tetraphosphate (Ap4A) HIT family hydrolase